MIGCLTGRFGVSVIARGSGRRRRVLVMSRKLSQGCRRAFSTEKDTPSFNITGMNNGITLNRAQTTSGIATSHFSTAMSGNDNESEGGKDATERRPTVDRRKREYRSSRNTQHNLPQNQQYSNDQQRSRPRFGQKSQRPFDSAIMKGSSSPNFGTNLFRSSFDLRLVKDSSHVPILIPGSPVVDDKPKKDNRKQHPESTQQQQQRRRRKLPLVNAAALLDTSTYCKISVTPASSGTKQNQQGEEEQQQPNAAKRLLRGKKDLYDMLRGHIIGMNQRPICLAGHGVPKQLLQDHINLADDILHHYQEPADCTLSSYSNHSPDTAEYENLDPFSNGMTIRGHDGKKRFKSWSIPTPSSNQYSNIHRHPDYPGFLQVQQGVSQEWADRLALYLAVMERLTRKLGSVGSSYLDVVAAAHSQHHDNNNCCSMHWNVTIYRGMAYPKEVISRQIEDDNHANNNEQQGPVPILEWTPHTNTKQQPRVSIILQGDPDSKHDIHLQNTKKTKKKKKGPVTLVYSASFLELPPPP
jgi:hypothetical protein